MENENYVLNVEPRVQTGSAAARKMRREGFIPAVVYHRGEEAVAATLGYNEFKRIASRSRWSQVFLFKSNDSSLNERSVIVKDLQLDPLKESVLHVDFLALSDNEEVSVRVPIKFVGEAVGVKAEGGMLAIAVRELGIRCLPKLIPQQLEVDVSKLRLGQSIHASDVAMGEGLSLVDEPTETIVSVLATRASISRGGAGAASEEGSDEGGA